MKIKVADIPQQGRELAFDLPAARLNERSDATTEKNGPLAAVAPSYRFSPDGKVKIKLNVERVTVVVSGTASAQYTTVCSRCAEDTTKELSVKLDMILKPRSTRGPVEAGDEDISFGFYDDQEIDCSVVAEEFLILALPYTVLCKEDCKGLCPHCGANLNNGTCSCKDAETSANPFSVLKQLKVH